jgi:predicted GNAT family acetyltransferase
MKNNLHVSRFELEAEGLITFANYHLNQNILTITHVETPVEQRGSGFAGKLMEEIAKKARAENLKIIPVCSYAALWLRRHKEFQDLVG